MRENWEIYKNNLESSKKNVLPNCIFRAITPRKLGFIYCFLKKPYERNMGFLKNFLLVFDYSYLKARNPYVSPLSLKKSYERNIRQVEDSDLSDRLQSNAVYKYGHICGNALVRSFVSNSIIVVPAVTYSLM